ncbi:sulfotransferase family cytosolic 1B member 1-like isoform X2 [Mizuhopecten yessoensis]|nr:sulfotransferase family cytosolic 1B member 1-like isoform X2 [Mizuhopecten yessoensis]XP_021341132.1 sulfotransferase family cytosolic 1B member 1-like isoform X2 [Mizuhopecten yessoensis]
MSKNVDEVAALPGHRLYKDYLIPVFTQMHEDINDHMEKTKNFSSRETDVLICTFPKSGTNWINEIVGMMVKGRAEYSKSYKLVAMLERMSDVTSLSNLPSDSIRVLNTHLPFPDLPRKHVEGGYKIVHVVRNPKDVAVSYYNDTIKRKRCLPDGQVITPPEWSEWLERYCRPPHKYSGWFNYEKGFESAKDIGALRSVFTIQYEHLKMNPLPILKNLAAYLGVDLAEHTLMAINDKCSFANMSTAGARAKDNAIRQMSIDGSNFMFRKGIIGDWKNWFTVAQNETFDKIIETEMKDSSLRVVYE